MLQSQGWDVAKQEASRSQKLRCAVVVDTSGQALLRHRGAVLKALKNHAETVVALAPFDFAYAGMTREEFLGDFEQAAIILKEMPFDRRGTNPFHDVVTFIKLLRAMVELAPDLTLAFTPKGIILASFAALLAGVPNRYGVLAGLGYLFSNEISRRPTLRRVSHFVLRRALRRNTKVIVQNPDHLQFLIEEGFIKEACRGICVSGAGVNINRFVYVEPALNPVTFLFMSRMYREKGALEFVKAARLVKKRFPEAVFQMAGHIDGAPDCVTRSEVAAWQQEGSVRYLGHASDVRSFLTNCSVFVLPSYYQEGLPSSILEAMATGRAVITTDWPGCREPVNNGFNGLLVKPRDAVALAKTMEYFLENPQMIVSMGRKSRHLAETKFSLDIVVHQMLCAMNLQECSRADNV